VAIQRTSSLDDRRPTTDDQQALSVVGRRLSVVLLLACFLALATIYNATVPLGEGPDEPGHFNYVLFLAREGRLPVQRAAPEPSDVPGEGHQPPLAYLLSLPAVAWLAPEQRQIAMSSDPDLIWNGGTGVAAFMRGSREYWPWQGTVLAWHLARGTSALWGVLTVLFTYLAACRAQEGGRERGFALLAAALVAFNPQFLFTSALVSNDGLLAALGAILLWACLDRQLTLPRCLLLGLLFGLALLTKQSALLFGPLLVWAAWRNSEGNLRRWFVFCLVWGATALLVAGWWYIRNWQLYGDPLGLAVFKAEFTTQPFAWHDPAAWVSALAQLHSSFWARFGWMSLQPTIWVIWFYNALTTIASIGLFWRLRDWRLEIRNSRVSQSPNLPISNLQSSWLSPLILLAMAFAWTLSFALAAGLVAWQGRMLFPAISAIALLLSHGLSSILSKAKSKQWQGYALRSMLYALLVLALVLPFTVIAPAYQWRVLPPQVAQAELGQPVYARYAPSWKRGVELRGYRLGGTQRPATDLSVMLTWHALEPLPINWTVFVHLVDANDQIVAESNSIPQGGAFPMPRWSEGDWVADQHTIPLPAELPPGEYRLLVGLYRADTRSQRREDVWAADGSELGSYVELGEITIK
jgi:hypothetical protein